MGIRVKKILGYGLQPFEPHAGWDNKCNQAYELTVFGFYTWCKENFGMIQEKLEFSRLTMIPFNVEIRAHLHVSKEDSQYNRKIRKEPLGRAFEYDSEFGIEDLLVLMPPEQVLQWRRFDDIIDFTEETQVHEQKNRVIFLAKGIDDHAKGNPPASVGALLIWLGIPDPLEAFRSLQEILYVFWS